MPEVILEKAGFKAGNPFQQGLRVTVWRGKVKVCGVDGDGNQTTPFSNIISSGPVPTE
jgi:hypothetical protein